MIEVILACLGWAILCTALLCIGEYIIKKVVKA